MSAVLNYRLATPKDSAAYAALLPTIAADPGSGAHKLADASGCRAALEKMAASGTVYLVVGEDAAGALLASCVLVIVPNISYDGRPWAVVEHVVVHPSLRGKGAGSALIEWAVDYARSKRCYKVQLISGDEAAQTGFYRKLGFQSDGLVGFKKYL